MSSIQWNDQTDLDKETRARMNQRSAEEYEITDNALIIIALIIGLVAGMCIGSALHDSLVHPTEVRKVQ